MIHNVLMPRAAWLLLLPLLLVDCRNERPAECQKLRQCCEVARSEGKDLEDVRVACTRADDSDPVLCTRRLDQVKASLPMLADRPECRLAQP